MAISTYAELQTAVKNWLGRDDLTSRIPEFISAAEIRLCDDVKVKAMEASLTGTLSSGAQTVSYPSDAHGIKGKLFLIEDDSRSPVFQRSESEVKATFADKTATGKPDYFYISDGNLVFSVISDDDYALEGTYYKRLTLSDSTPTNWFTDNYPMALLYATLIEAYTYTEDDSRMYQLQYMDMVQRIKRHENFERAGGSNRRFRQVAL